MVEPAVLIMLVNLFLVTLLLTNAWHHTAAQLEVIAAALRIVFSALHARLECALHLVTRKCPPYVLFTHIIAVFALLIISAPKMKNVFVLAMNVSANTVIN